MVRVHSYKHVNKWGIPSQELLIFIPDFLQICVNLRIFWGLFLHVYYDGNELRWWGTGKPGALQFLGLQRVKQLSNQTTTTTNVSFRNHSATGLAKKPIWVFLPCCYVKTRGTFWPIQYFFQTWVLPGPKGTEPATALGAHADVLISPLSLCVALGS